MQSRPIFLNLFQIRFPITAIASIIHRISGVILFFFIPILLKIFDNSLYSEDYFNEIQTYTSSIIIKISIWIILLALFYHLLAGIRHMIMDCGYFESKEAGNLGARVLFILFIILAVLTGVWLW